MKKDEVVYLRGLSAAEVQSRIESTKDIPPVEELQTLTLRKKKKKKKKNPELCVDAADAGSVDNSSSVAPVSKKSIPKLQGAEKTTISLDEPSKSDEHAEIENVEGALASGFEAEGVSGSGIETEGSVSGMSEDKTVANAITNLLSTNWDSKVRQAIAELEASKKEGEENHIYNIQWLNGVIDDMAKSKRKKEKGVEALREHLAWEHIHSVFKGGHREVMREHLNKAKELLLMNLSRKVGVQYQDMPEPKQLEADVYAQLERVKNILSPADIDEWLFGITCQTRSIAHVYSHFKAIYPNNQRFVQLYRSWYSLKSLYPYQS
ncbi:hypothetical protein [Kistimonas scapharcae]|uniref:hypothetical protein n=1 Tax=Kistimonas scapharcae TaxID=1036133 RepID=UPI0031EAEBBE